MSSTPTPPAAEPFGVDGINVTAAIGATGLDAARHLAADGPAAEPRMAGYVALDVRISNGEQGTAIPGHLPAADATVLALAIYRAAVEAETDALIYNLVTELGDKTLADALLAAVYQARKDASVPDHAPPA